MTYMVTFAVRTMYYNYSVTVLVHLRLLTMKFTFDI